MRFRHQTFDAPELKKWVFEDNSQTESTTDDVPIAGCWIRKSGARVSMAYRSRTNR
jgi:hypothetical protein